MTPSATTTRLALAAATVALLGVAITPGLASAAAKTVLVSQSSGGQKGNDHSGEPSTSKDGRYIAFSSEADNLVPDDTNGRLDCFVRDRIAGTTTRVSVESDGSESNGRCFGPAISQDGRWVTFDSNASDLGATGLQVYLHDRQSGSTVLVSKRWNADQGGNGESADPAISGNGRYVVFESKATDLVARNGAAHDGNGTKADVYLYDRVTQVTKRVSVRSNGTQGNAASFDAAISANGSYVVFSSKAKLVPQDTNGKLDVYVHARTGGKTMRVSVSSNERQGNGASGNATVSNDGRWIAFESRASNFVGADQSKDMDVFLRDRKNGKTSLVSVSSNGTKAKGGSGDPTISSSGRWIAFESSASNLVSKDPNGRWDSFVRDRVKGTTKIISRRGNGQPANGDGDDPFVSGNGKFVAFESTARGIVAKDGDTVEDVFLRGPLR